MSDRIALNTCIAVIAFTLGLITTAFAQTTSTAPVPGNVPTAPAGPLSLELAYQAASTALASCKANGFPNATVAVSDINGIVLVILRSPAAAEPTVESARRKAYTVAKTKMSTADFAKSKGWVDGPPPGANAARPANSNPRDPFAGLPVFDNDPNLVPWSGGLPILSGGKIVGGIGLSGAAGGQKDEDCVKAGADVVKDKAK